MECTGKLKTMTELERHIVAGAKNVILSAPPKSPSKSASSDEKPVPTFVIGANHQSMKKGDSVVSIGSCTTNCLAPLAKVINDEFGIEKGFVTTIHAYTNDQNILDGHHKDLRRARSATMSMIPTSTGVSGAIKIVLPELEGKIDGASVRVPVPNVSMVDCAFVVSKGVNTDEANDMLVKKSQDDFFKTALLCTSEPLVSSDFVHNASSGVVDLLETRVIGGNMLRVVSWYDNEWAFSMRMVDTAIAMMLLQR
jgi:glyceraldehyde 3-phosphate dehydrogenase